MEQRVEKQQKAGVTASSSKHGQLKEKIAKNSKRRRKKKKKKQVCWCKAKAFKEVGSRDQRHDDTQDKECGCLGTFHIAEEAACLLRGEARFGALHWGRHLADSLVNPVAVLLLVQCLTGFDEIPLNQSVPLPQDAHLVSDSDHAINPEFQCLKAERKISASLYALDQKAFDPNGALWDFLMLYHCQLLFSTT